MKISALNMFLILSIGQIICILMIKFRHHSLNSVQCIFCQKEIYIVTKSYLQRPSNLNAVLTVLLF